MPETSTKRATPTAAASRASVLGTLLVHRLESHAAGLDIGGDGVDDGVGPGEAAATAAWSRTSARKSVTRSKSAVRRALRARSGRRTATRRVVPSSGEMPHQTSAEEPRAAEYGDRSHGIPLSMLDKIDPQSRQLISFNFPSSASPGQRQRPDLFGLVARQRIRHHHSCVARSRFNSQALTALQEVRMAPVAQR